MRGGWEENQMKFGKETTEWEKSVNCHESYGDDIKGQIFIFFSRNKQRENNTL